MLGDVCMNEWLIGNELVKLLDCLPGYKLGIPGPCQSNSALASSEVDVKILSIEFKEQLFSIWTWYSRANLLV